MKYRLLYNKITVVVLSAVLSMSAVSCGKLDASKLDGNALTVYLSLRSIFLTF